MQGVRSLEAGRGMIDGQSATVAVLWRYPVKSMLGYVAVPASMTIIMVMSDTTLPLSEIKKRLSEIVDGVESTHDRVILTRNGRAAAVIMSPDDLEALEETVEILSNPVAVRAIRRAETEIDKGRSLTADQLRTKYLKR
jgi:antitoxin YefM